MESPQRIASVKWLSVAGQRADWYAEDLAAIVGRGLRVCLAQPCPWSSSLLARAGELWVNLVRIRPPENLHPCQVKLYNLTALSQVIFLRATGFKKLMCSSIYLREFGHIASK